MDLGELTIVNGAAALFLAIGLTKLFTMIVESMGLTNARNFAPLFAVLASAVAVAVLIDRDATGQDYWLAVILVALSAVGLHSGATHVGEGVQKMAHRQ